MPEAKSKEGAGDDLLSDDYGGRLTMELVDSMHDVSQPGLSLMKRADERGLVEEVENGTTVNWGICRPAWWIRDVRGDDGDDHLEPGE